MNRRTVTIILIQTILLGIEIGTNYDTGVRQAALVFTNLVATTGILLLDRRWRRRGASLALMTVIFVIAAVWLDALGNFQHLYGGYWWWDRVTHAVGGLAVSALFIDLTLARRRIGNLTISLGLALWHGFLLGQFFAAMYEVSEWLGDWWFHTQRVRGTYDTPHDLFFNAVGGGAVVLLYWLMKKTRQQSLSS